MMTFQEFWNAREITGIFVVSTAAPAGKTYRLNLEDEGEDYCDLTELVQSGLFAEDESGQVAAWGLSGEEAPDGDWEWDGRGDIRDHQANSYTRIALLVDN